MIETLSDLICRSDGRPDDAIAIKHKSTSLSYGELRSLVSAFAANILRLGLARHDRVAIFAGKQPETVIAILGTSLAGGVFVPVNSLLKPAQVAHILKDCDVRMLVTTAPRLASLGPVLSECTNLRHVIIAGEHAAGQQEEHAVDVLAWEDMPGGDPTPSRPRVIASDVASILYTSGSTGKPKGVVLSHTNITVGAMSVAEYLENSPSDRILAALPFSFDAGLSQLTTGLSVGATVILHDYLLPRDVVRIVQREQVTGLTGVPPLWIQLAEQDWPEGSTGSLRYFANTGGKMPRDTLARLRKIFPQASPFLMYGLTEAFRSSYLPPSEVDRRPDSIGKAIPNVELMVVDKGGRICEPGEIGELVHRGPLVALGYWNDPERTAQRFRPVPGQPDGLPGQELAVWTGDSATIDKDGFLYFVGRMDDMIKTSGYRVSPTEIEETAYDSGLVSEVVALGVPHRQLGQGIVLVAKSRKNGDQPTEELLREMRPKVPNYMLPIAIRWKDSLPRNSNGKLDRKRMAEQLRGLFDEERPDD